MTSQSSAVRSWIYFDQIVDYSSCAEKSENLSLEITQVLSSAFGTLQAIRHVNPPVISKRKSFTPQILWCFVGRAPSS
jgi:hypothetical protein